MLASPKLCLDVLRHYSSVEGTPLASLLAQPSPDLVQPLSGGLINQTFLVQAGTKKAVLQRVNPLFGVAVHHDIAALTQHLHAQGMETPLLYQTSDGKLAVDLGPDGVWRLLTFVPGQTFHVVVPEVARAAGELVSRFHFHLLGLQHQFHFSRPLAHDLQRHLQNLREALAKAPSVTGVPPDFSALATEILARAEALPTEVAGPRRLCHGDLKISNLLFSREGDGPWRGRCLVDLDTLCSLPLGLELGDALRSWCNAFDENNPGGRFELVRFESALEGYAGLGQQFVTEDEAGALVPGTLRVALQLAARFAADVVNQSYFGWDAQRFSSRAEHNWVRALGQLSLARSLSDQQQAAEAVTQRLFHARKPQQS